MVELYINTGDTYSPNWESLDLFDEVSIIINQKVSDAQDVAKLFTTYSQKFKIPASPKNNRLMGGMFKRGRIDVSNSIPCKIINNKQLFSDGVISHGEADMEFGKIMNYNINFSSILSGIKERLGDALINELDLTGTEYSGWNNTTVTNSIRDGRTPIVSINRRLNADASDFTANNVRYKGVTPTGDKFIVKEELRPSVSAKRIFQQIMYNLGLDPSIYLSGADFVSNFDDLRLWCTSDNYKSRKLIPSTWDSLTPTTAYPFASPDPKWFIDLYSGDIISLWTTDPTNTQSGDLSYAVDLISAFDGMAEVKALVEFFDVTTGSEVLISSKSVVGTAVSGSPGKFNITASMIINNQTVPGTSPTNKKLIRVKITPNIYQKSSVPYNHMMLFQMANSASSLGILDGYYQQATVTQTVGSFDPGRLLPGIKQIDFLQSILKMYNGILYTEPDLDYREPSSLGLRRVLFESLGERPQLLEDLFTPDYSKYFVFSSNKIAPQQSYNQYSFAHTLGKDDTSGAWVEANISNPNSKEYGQLIYNKPSAITTSSYPIKTIFVTPPQELLSGTLVTNFSTIKDAKFQANQPIIFLTNSTDQPIPSSQSGQNPVALSYRTTDSGTAAFSTITRYGETSINERDYGGAFFGTALTFKDEVNLKTIRPNSSNLYSRYYDYTIQKITAPNRYVYKFEGYLTIDEINSYNIYKRIKIGDQRYDITESQLDITTGRIKLTCINTAPFVSE